MSSHLKWTRKENKTSQMPPRYVFISKPYHEFVEGTKDVSVKKPDLVLALNCGFIFYKEWDATMPSLTKYANVPLVFTEYYEEDCKLDLQKLGKDKEATMHVTN